MIERCERQPDPQEITSEADRMFETIRGMSGIILGEGNDLKRFSDGKGNVYTTLIGSGPICRNGRELDSLVVLAMRGPSIYLPAIDTMAVLRGINSDGDTCLDEIIYNNEVNTRAAVDGSNAFIKDLMKVIP